MTKSRLETFSDGVVAILITIMVLELKTPAGPTWAALGAHDVSVRLFTYLLSFVYIAMYWNNHHHMLHACTRVNGVVLWANTHLLFWLSLVPFATKWMEEEGFAPVPTAVYGLVLFNAGLAFNFLRIALIRLHGRDSAIARAIGVDTKGRISGLLTGLAVVLSLWQPFVGLALIVILGLIWIVPDTRVERTLANER